MEERCKGAWEDLQLGWDGDHGWRWSSSSSWILSLCCFLSVYPFACFFFSFFFFMFWLVSLFISWFLVSFRRSVSYCLV